MPKSKGRKTAKTAKRRPPARPRQATTPAAAASASPGQPGRRPSRPGFLLAVALLWILCGISALVGLDVSWKLIPGVVFIGIGLFFLRGAAATVLRQDQRR